MNSQEAAKITKMVKAINNEAEQHEAELSQKVEQLYWRRERADVGTPEYEDIDFDLRVANDDLDKLRSEKCEDHMTRIYPEGGYDRCMNCGSRF